MALLPEQKYFLTLSMIGFGLLWGVSLYNGTVTEMFRSYQRGHFVDETPFKTNYTGVLLLDFPLSFLVAFFFYGTNGSDESLQIFLIDAYATLQSAFVWLYIESSRRGQKPFPVANPIIWGSLWQAFGAAISLPLYYLNHHDWLSEQRQPVPQVSLAAALTTPLSFSVGAALPAVIGMLPTWMPRSATTHQNVLAAWQLDPVWVCILQYIGLNLFTMILQPTKEDGYLSSFWVRISYLMAAAFSTVGHVYAVVSIALSSDPALSLLRTYVPLLHSEPSGVGNRLLSGPRLFLQFDLIIISLSSLSWAYIILRNLLVGQASIRRLLPIMLVMGGVVLGPGATVSLALLWRENLLQQLRARPMLKRESEKNSGSGR